MKFGKAFSFRFLFILLALITIASLIVGNAVLAQPSASPYPSATATSPTPTAKATATAVPTTSAAASPSPTPTTASLATVFGQVLSIASDKTSFIIQRDNQSSLTINVNTNTRYYIETITAATLSFLAGDLETMMGSMNMFGVPEESGTDGMMGTMHGVINSASFSDITVGDLVVVKGLTSNNTARLVVIVRLPDNLKLIQGKVSAVASASISITPVQGSAVTLGWDSSSRFVLQGLAVIQAGQRVSAIYDSSTNLFKVAIVRTAAATPTPSGSATPTATAAVSPSPSATVTPSPSKTVAPSATVTASPTASAAAFTVNTMTKSGLGTYLVDASGKTLYFTTRDAVGKSNITGTTLQTWPVFYAPTINVPSSLKASDFGSITRSDGAMQTTFRGYPLYHFSGDTAAGNTNGQGVGGVWFVVNPSNFPPAASSSVTASPSMTASPSPSATASSQ